MTEKELTKVSKFMSLVLRHEPEVIGAKLEEDGWMALSTLHAGLCSRHPEITFADILTVVESSEKKRFQVSDDGANIRAVQGHSVEIEGSTVTKANAPNVLFHGTASKNVDLILANGLKPMSRIHVHLSSDIETATIVGRRHGVPAVFEVDAARAQEDGISFFVAENGVWLCDALSAEYLTLLP